MKFKFLKFGFILAALVISFISCKEDDDGVVNEFVEQPRDDQQVLDNAELLDYMSTHYYNSSFFESGTNHRINDIVITELPVDEDGNYLDMPDPANNTLLIDAVDVYTTVYLDFDYEYYILNLNQGGGVAPRFSDQVRVRYEGFLADTEEVFDGNATPIDLPLQTDGFSGGAIKGWQLVMPKFNSAESFMNGTDGITNYNNYGLGIMFIPSGLAYYSFPRPGIPTYSNLVFKFELLQYEEDDHENDGVPTHVEDYNGNEDAFDDDTDEDGTPDFIDFDDDGDGVLTIFEDINEDGDPTNDDTDGDGIPNYLDEDSTESNQPDS